MRNEHIDYKFTVYAESFGNALKWDKATQREIYVQKWRIQIRRLNNVKRVVSHALSLIRKGYAVEIRDQHGNTLVTDNLLTLASENQNTNAVLVRNLLAWNKR